MGIDRLLPVKGSSSITRNGQSGRLVDYFVEQICLSEGWNSNNPAVCSKVEKLLSMILANSILGMTGEYRVYCKLVKKFGKDSVRLADGNEEGTDVDLYLFDKPVSVKCHMGFKEKTFNKKRFAEGLSKPVVYVGVSMYVDDPEKVMVAWPGEKLVDGYVYEDIESLERLRSVSVEPDSKRAAYAVGAEVMLSDGRVIKKWKDNIPHDILDDIDELLNF